MHEVRGTRRTWLARGRARRERGAGCEKGKAPRQGRCECRGWRWAAASRSGHPTGVEVPAGTSGAEMFPKWNHRARVGAFGEPGLGAASSGEP